MRKWKKHGEDLLFKDGAEFSPEMYSGDFVRHGKKNPTTLKPVRLKSQVMRIRVFPSNFFCFFLILHSHVNESDKITAFIDITSFY